MVIWLKNSGSTNCRPGCRQLGADHHRHRRADDEHDEAEDQVERADVLVVGREEPTLDEALLVAVRRGHRAGRRAECVDMAYLGNACDQPAADAAVGAVDCGRRRRGFGGRRRCRRGVGRRGSAGAAAARRRRRRRGAARSSPSRAASHGRELRLRHRAHHDRHEAVVLAAQLGALAAVDAGPFDVGPGLVDDARDRVLLPAQRRHPPGVDHVVGGDHEADLGVDRQHQRVVDVEQVMRVGRDRRPLAALADAVAVAIEAAGAARRLRRRYSYFHIHW